MKRSIIRWAPFVLSALLAGGCLLDSQRGELPTGQATDIAPGDTVYRSLSGPAGSRDTLYLAFSADSGYRYRLQASDSASRLQLAVVGSDGSLLYTSAVPDATGRWTLVDFPCALSGTYRLRITGPAGVAFASTIQAIAGLPSTFVEPDPSEVDSTIHLAKEVLANGIWNARTGTSGTTGDVDWIFVAVHPGHTYTVDFHDSVVLYGTTHTLWSADSVRIGNPSSGSLSYTSFDEGRIYVRVDCTPSGVRYRLRVSDTAGYPVGSVKPDAYERDDSLHPALLKPDSSALLRTFHGLGTSRDTDWTRIDLPAGSSWTLVMVDSTRSANLELFDPSTGLDAGPFRSRSAGSTTVDSFTLFSLAARSLVLRVGGTTPGAYVLRAWATGPLPDSMRMADAWEPDSPSSPANFPADSVLRSRTLHGDVSTRDTDWTAIPVDSGRTYRVVVVDSFGRVNASLVGIPGGT